MSKLREYQNIIIDAFNKITDDENNKSAIEKGAELIAESVAKDELIYIVGPGGHSNMIGEESLCRTGMLVGLNPMLDATNLIFGTSKTRMLQRHPQYAASLLDEYYIERGNVLIIVNAYGINALTIELALEAKRRGINVIGIASSDHFNNTPPDHPARHISKKNMIDVVDVFIDCYMPHGDSVISLDGADQKVAGTATLCNIYTYQLLMLRSVEKLIEKGYKPKIWRSVNMPGGDDYNKEYFKEYGKRIKYLL